MDDLGNPISYVVLERGTPVYSSDGERVGTVAHVLAVEDKDIFDGIVIGDVPGVHRPGRSGHRFVDAPEVGAIYDNGVQLTIDAAACAELPEPTENPGEYSLGPDGSGGPGLGDKLRRAWQGLSGRDQRPL